MITHRWPLVSDTTAQPRHSRFTLKGTLHPALGVNTGNGHKSSELGYLNVIHSPPPHQLNLLRGSCLSDCIWNSLSPQLPHAGILSATFLCSRRLAARGSKFVLICLTKQLFQRFSHVQQHECLQGATVHRCAQLSPSVTFISSHTDAVAVWNHPICVEWRLRPELNAS